jgi:hypothetical protein
MSSPAELTELARESRMGGEGTETSGGVHIRQRRDGTISEGAYGSR